jgi:hypothetical protein
MGYAQIEAARRAAKGAEKKGKTGTAAATPPGEPDKENKNGK